MRLCFIFSLILFSAGFIYTEISPNAGVTLTDGVSVYKIPDLKSEVITTLKMNQMVDCLGIAKNEYVTTDDRRYKWIHIRHGEQLEGWMKQEDLAVSVTAKFLRKDKLFSECLPYHLKEIEIDSKNNIKGQLWFGAAVFEFYPMKEVKVFIITEDQSFHRADDFGLIAYDYGETPYKQLKSIRFKDILGDSRNEIIIEYNWEGLTDPGNGSGVSILSDFNGYKKVFKKTTFRLDHALEITFGSLDIKYNEIIFSERRGFWDNRVPGLSKKITQYIFNSNIMKYEENDSSEKQIHCIPEVNLRLRSESNINSSIIMGLEKGNTYQLMGIPMFSRNDKDVKINNIAGIWLPIFIKREISISPDLIIWGWAFSAYLETDDPVINNYIKGFPEYPAVRAKIYLYVSFSE